MSHLFFSIYILNYQEISQEIECFYLWAFSAGQEAANPQILAKIQGSWDFQSSKDPVRIIWMSMLSSWSSLVSWVRQGEARRGTQVAGNIYNFRALQEVVRHEQYPTSVWKGRIIMIWRVGRTLQLQGTTGHLAGRTDISLMTILKLKTSRFLEKVELDALKLGMFQSSWLSGFPSLRTMNITCPQWLWGAQLHWQRWEHSNCSSRSMVLG